MTSDPVQISHYRIESTLGQGGMGVVYLAEDLLLRRRVALKFLSPSLSRDAAARRRFLNEGRAAATLGHPNAAVLYEVGAEGDDLFLAMEYVPGTTLKEYGADGPLPWVEAVDIALGVLAALREAHAKGIVHRDIKPQNIRRTPDGRIKVLDFGLAKVLGGSTITREGSIMGTAAYMSPQQVVGEDVDGRTDLYSLGVVLYELLTGRAPFTGDQEVAVAHAILHEDPITIRELNPEVPAELEHIVFKAMMKRLPSRYQTAEEMAEDLARFREHDRRRRAGIHEELDLIATQEVFDVRRERFLAPLVGRDAEIQKIRGFLREARTGEGMAVCVAGEAGVGKTRLLEELQQACRREGARVIVSPCLFGGTTSSYFPFAEAFRHYFSLRGVTGAAALQTFLFDRAPRLGGSLPVLNRFLRFTFASNGPTSEEELWEVLDQLVAFIAEERPLVLMIEDLQWGDDASIRLFHFLAQRVARRRLLLVGSYRPEEIQSEPGARPHPLPALLRMLGREERFERIEISRLRREHVKEILDRLYPEHEWSEDFPGLLYRETEGNPFFMVEILKLLSGEKVLEQRDGRWILRTTVDRISIPEKVFDVVMQRLGRLGPREREILELGAVEGDVFHSGTILRGLRIERMALLKTLQFLEQVHHLIHAAGPQYHFDHSKIREILYESIPPELRIEYHTVVGQFLRESFGESEEYAGIIAHNLLSAGLRDEAIPFLRRAAAAASRLFAHSDAIHYLDQAERVLHELYPQHPPVERVRELCEVRERRGDEEYASGHYRESLASYELAFSLDAATADPVRAASLTKAIGRIQYLLGRTAESQRSYDKAIADYTGIEERARAEGDTERLATACRELGKLHFFRGDLDRARRYIDETIALADRIDSPRMKSAALNNLAGIHYQRGALEEALSAHRASLGIRRETRNPGEMAQTHKNLGITHYRLGELSDAESHLDEALGLYRKTADRRGEAVTLRHLGNVYYERGDHVGAQRHWESSLSLCRELGNHEDLCRCLNNLGVLHFERGHYASAYRLYQDALEASAAVGSKEPVVPVYVNLAELHLSLDQLARAEENLDRAEELARAMEMTPALSEIHALRGMLLAERGSLDRARAEVERASETAEPTGHVENVVRALLAQAAVCIASGEHEDARRLARQARDLARWSRMLHFELRAAFVVASACWKDGDRWDATKELRDLVPRAEEGGFRPLAARGRDLLGTILWDAGDAQGAAGEFVRAADQMKEIIATLSEEDLRSFVHHPEWKAAIGNLLDTLMRLGRRDEALAYLVPLGVGACDLGSARDAPADLADIGEGARPGPRGGPGVREGLRAGTGS
jgi:tetratricopeptide (TPR) repeat protein/tRNA A-37 threonylcarbamoyl transferase component Bud32